MLELHLSHLRFPRIRIPPHVLSQHTLRFAWPYACAIGESMRCPACFTLACRTKPVHEANFFCRHQGQKKQPSTLKRKPVSSSMLFVEVSEYCFVRAGSSLRGPETAHFSAACLAPVNENAIFDSLPPFIHLCRCRSAIGVHKIPK